MIYDAKSIVERLEDRRMLSAAPGQDGPIITGEEFIGPVNAVTALVLQFNQHLNPATAGNIKAYHIGRNFGSSDSGGGFNPLGFLSVRQGAGSTTVSQVTERPTGISPAAIFAHPDASVGTVTYNDADETVTIYAQAPFKATEFLRFIKVIGAGPNAVEGTNGLALDGDRNGHPGGNQVIRYRFFRTKTLGYNDAQGSRVVLKLHGPGGIVAFLPRQAPQPVVFLENSDPNSSILTGTVTPSKHSDGTTTIQEISGTTEAQVELGAQFNVTYTQP